jgi:hypothetical protein
MTIKVKAMVGCGPAQNKVFAAAVHMGAHHVERQAFRQRIVPLRRNPLPKRIATQLGSI